jgi:hypothetical protein
VTKLHVEKRRVNKQSVQVDVFYREQDNTGREQTNPIGNQDKSKRKIAGKPPEGTGNWEGNA